MICFIIKQHPAKARTQPMADTAEEMFVNGSEQGARPEAAATARPRVKSGVTTALALDICTSVFQPGSFLPRENDLCERYGVSRTVIREALKVLEAKRLVRGRSRVGTVVCERDEWNIIDPQLIEWLGDTILELGLLECILEARQVIEPAAAVLAAEKASLQEIADLEQAWQMMRDSEHDPVAFTEADAQFHACLLKASHNQVFAQLARTIEAALNYMLQQSNNAVVTREEAVRAHGLLVEALRMRDSAAAQRHSMGILELSARDLKLVKAETA